MSSWLLLLLLLALLLRPPPLTLAEESREVAPSETAVVVYDVWDAHWCGPASERASLLAGRVDAALRRWRRRGIGLVAMAPNGVAPAAAAGPARQRALRCSVDAAANGDVGNGTGSALHLAPPLDASRWVPPVASDPLHTCEAPGMAPARRVWLRQHPSIVVEASDRSPDVWTTDRAELACLLRRRGIRRVLLVGVHANLCMLWIHPLSLAWLLANQAPLGLTSLAVVSDLSDSISDGTAPGGPQAAHAKVLDWVNATLGVPAFHSRVCLPAEEGPLGTLH